MRAGSRGHQRSQSFQLVARVADVADDPREGRGGLPPVPSRIVPVTIVQQKYGAGPETPAHPGTDQICSRSRRVPHAEGPTKQLVVVGPYRPGNEGTTISVRCPEAPGDLSGHAGDRLVGSSDLVSNLAGTGE